MTVDGIKSFLKVRPFRPFELRESSGEVHRVVSPESIHIADKLGLVILYPPDGSLVMLDRVEITAVSYPAEKPSKRAKHSLNDLTEVSPGFSKKHREKRLQHVARDGFR